MRWLIRGLGSLLAPMAQRFYQSLSQPQMVQRDLQKQLFKQLVQSDYGQSLNIDSIDDWQKIPLVTYETLHSWIEAKNSLTSESVLFYEETSGSSGPAKLIPYTRSLRKSFNTLFCIWAYDLIVNGPRFETGKIYMCISPKLLAPGDVSTGLQDDSDYLDLWLRWLLKPFLVSPPNAHKPQTPEVFQANLCRTLLLAENLETISVWSPSFLRVQLDYIQTHRKALRSQLTRLSPERSQLLTAETIHWEALWPKLKLISCWDSALAADQVSNLQASFPNTLIQGKGLLATEAPMTVPLINANGCVPLLGEVFFEFENSAGQIYWLHELTIGQTYTVIISQKGGLYRYRMCDRVQVTHYYRATPCLRFLGRSNATSDMVGEKLTPDAVSQVIKTLDLPTSTFKCLVPNLLPHPHYTLLIDRINQPIGHLAVQLDQALCAMFHYRQARLLGQLHPARVICQTDISQRLMQYHYQQGKRLGDIKYPCLMTMPIDTSNLVSKTDFADSS